MSNFGQALYLGSFSNPTGKFASSSALGMASVFDASPNGFPLSPPYVNFFTPLAANTANVATLQTLPGAGALTLTAGTGNSAATIGGYPFIYIGPNQLVRNLARAITLTSAANLSAINFTITGLDYHNRVIVQTLAGPNANTVTTLKTFQAVYSVTADAAVPSNVSVGTSDTFGLPMRCGVRGFLSARWDTGATEDAGTFVASSNVALPTPSTGDIRGTYTPSSASNGTRLLVLYISKPFETTTPDAYYGVAWQVQEASIP